MVVFTSLSKLTNLEEKEIAYIKANSKDGKLVVITDIENISVSVMKLMCEYGDRTEFITSAENDFSFGFQLGVMLAGQKDEAMLLIDREVSIDLPNIKVGIPEKKSRKKEDSKCKDKPSLKEATNVATAEDAKPMRKRRTKAEMEAAKEEAKGIIISEDDFVLPFPEGYSQGTFLKEDLREKMIAGENKELAKIAENELLYKRLVRAVKDSSDKKIGLEMLLNVHIGKDITPAIIKDIQSYYYDDIKQMK